MLKEITMIKFWTVMMIIGIILAAIVALASTYIWIFILIPIGLGTIRGILK